MARGGAATRFPGTPTELADMLADPAAAAQAMGGTPAEWRQFQNEYAAAVGANDPGIDVQVKEQVQQAVFQMLRGAGRGAAGGGQRLDLAPVAGSRSAAYNPKALGAKVDGLFSDLGELVAASWHRGNPDDSTRGKLSQLRNAFGSTVPSDGGFLIPEAMRSELLKLSLETSIVRPRARVIPMGSLTVPIPMIDSTSHATSVHGGMIGSWTEESAQLTDTSPKFGRIKLEAKKLTCYSEVPNELFADAPALGGFIEVSFPETLSFFEDDAFLSGSGAGEPLGALNSAAAVVVTKESGQLADTIVWENLTRMYSRMLPGSLRRAVWVAHPSTFHELATMALSVGTGGGPVWLGGGGATSGADPAPTSILGRPLIFSEKVPPLGDEGDISFIDFGHYLIGDRQAAELTSSEHFKFQNDQTAVRIISRVDGRLWLQSAITPRQGTDTLSPVVKLAARA